MAGKGSPFITIKMATPSLAHKDTQILLPSHSGNLQWQQYQEKIVISTCHTRWMDWSSCRWYQCRTYTSHSDVSLPSMRHQIRVRNAVYYLSKDKTRISQKILLMTQSTHPQLQAQDELHTPSNFYIKFQKLIVCSPFQSLHPHLCRCELLFP